MLKTCQVCAKNFVVPGSRSAAKFCSIECKSESQRATPSHAVLYEAKMRSQSKRSTTCLAKVMSKDTAELTPDLARMKVIVEQKFKCLECGLDNWRGQLLVLEIDHINGVHNDNTRSNLRALCPNCHSQTTTWRGRDRGEAKRGEAYKRTKEVSTILGL